MILTPLGIKKEKRDIKIEFFVLKDYIVFCIPSNIKGTNRQGARNIKCGK